MQTAIQYLDMKLKKEPDGTKAGAWKELICKYKANTSIDDTLKMPETHKPQMNKDVLGTLTLLVFTGKVRLASEGRALTIEVLKTSQLIMATKSQLHVTLAYHADQTFLEHIVKTTEKWINNLSIS